MPAVPKTLRVRLFLTILIPVLALIVGTFFAAVGLNQTSLEASTIDALKNKVEGLASQVAEQGVGSLDPLRSGLALADERLESLPLGAVGTLLSGGAVSELSLRGAVSGSVTLSGTRYVYAARRIGDQAIVLLRPFQEEPVLIPGAYVALGAGFGLPVLVLAVLLAVFASRAVARPIERVGEAGRELAAGLSPAPVRVRGPRELRALAASFNQMAEELRRAREAERSFLLSVSHELKTPLAAVKGYAEALRDGVLGAEEAGGVILEESERLERLVTDLLELARLRQPKFQVKEEAVDLEEVASRVIQRHEPQARALGVYLKAEVTSPASARADADRVVQAVSNLVENALRYTPAGRAVTIQANGASIAVKDEGPGLTPDDLAHAFERFFLHRRYSSTRPVGTGLGLALVKDLAEAMGGTVSASSTQGEGTTFTLHLRSSEETLSVGI